VGEATIPIPSEDAGDGLERNAKRNFHVAAYWSFARDEWDFRDFGKVRHYLLLGSLLAIGGSVLDRLRLTQKDGLSSSLGTVVKM